MCRCCGQSSSTRNVATSERPLGSAGIAQWISCLMIPCGTSSGTWWVSNKAWISHKSSTINLVPAGFKMSVHILGHIWTLCTFQSSINHRFRLISSLLVICCVLCVWLSLLFACSWSVLLWDPLKALRVLDSSTQFTALSSRGPHATSRRPLSVCAVHVRVLATHVDLNACLCA